MDFHPIANLFPLMNGEPFDELAEDVRVNDLLQAIVIYENKILDGRNRYRACLATGVTPRFVDFNGKNPLAFVISSNLHRRHLSPSQLGMIAGRLANMPKHANQHTDKHLTEVAGIPATSVPAVSQNEAAKLLNVSRDTVQQAVLVLDQAEPEIIALVDAGEISVNAAIEVSYMTKERQTELAEQGTQAVKAAAKKTRSRKSPKKVAETNGHATQADVPKPEHKPSAEALRLGFEGVGVVYAHEAINCLTRIPKNDALRKQGFRLVKDWIKRNP